MQAFIDDLRCQKADSILKRLYKQWTGLDQPPVSSSASEEAEAARRSTSSSGVKTTSVDNEVEEVENDEEEDLGGTEHHSFVLPPAPELASGVILSELRINPVIFDACCAMLERQIKPYEDSFVDDQENYDANCLVTDLEWELVNNYSVDKPCAHSLPSDVPEPVDIFMREKEDMDVK
eukprot:gene15103-19292_t